MLFPDARFSRPETMIPTKSPSTLQSSIPLCDLRDLCAMLFPDARLSAQKRSFPPKTFPLQSLIPLCDLRALCAMLFPDALLSRPETMLSTKSPFPPPILNPLCDLRALCAMLFLDARLSRPEAMQTRCCPPSNYSRSNSEISAIDKPLIIGSSLSTVDWIMARFFC